MAARRVRMHPELGYSLVGFVAEKEAVGETTIEGVPCLGAVGELSAIIRREDIDEVFLARPGLSHQELLEIMSTGETERVGFKVISDIFEVITSNVTLGTAGDLPVVDLRAEGISTSRQMIKRSTDVLGALALLVLSAPFALWAWLGWRRAFSSVSVLTRYRLVGQQGKVLSLTLFRELPPKYKPGRLSRAIVRRGLHQICFLAVEVLRGRLSLVGRKPESPEALPTYSGWLRKRLLLKPGLTGLWLIIVPDDPTGGASAQYDFYYLKNQSLLLDLLILAKSLPYLVRGFPDGLAPYSAPTAGGTEEPT
jgi:lipopolysaccharide/colanic/teichoic acid biosynthesis glycosyltransferase